MASRAIKSKKKEFGLFVNSLNFSIGQLRKIHTDIIEPIKFHTVFFLAK